LISLKDLIRILPKCAQGKGLVETAAVSFCDYWFVFNDISFSVAPYLTFNLSSKVCGVGAFRDLVKNLEDENYRFYDSLCYDDEEDLFFAGSLKTLLPTLKFGGDEVLFKAWMLVKTPDNKIFPATFYYGPSGTSLGGWRSWKYGKVFSEGFTSVINSSPFDFSKVELDALVEALELALGQVPTTDFYGIYQCDDGFFMMGLKNRNPFIVNLGYSYEDDAIKNVLDRLS